MISLTYVGAIRNHWFFQKVLRPKKFQNEYVKPTVAQEQSFLKYSKL